LPGLECLVSETCGADIVACGFHRDSSWHVRGIFICFGLAALLDLLFPSSESDGTSELDGFDDCMNAYVGKIIGFFSIGNIYTFARTTLIVLMMLSLRSLPPGAYDTVAWNKFIPHANL